MIQSAWLFVGTVAILSTAGALLTTDDGMAILLGVAGFGGWGVTSYGAFQVEVASNGSVLEFTMPAVAIMTAGLALIPLYIALTGPTAIVQRARNPSLDEV